MQLVFGHFGKQFRPFVDGHGYVHGYDEDRELHPIRTAEAFGVEELIDPRETRARLCQFANLAAPLRQLNPAGFQYRP